WSPDGHWIAFESQGGYVRYLGDTRIGLYNVARGKLSYPGFSDIATIAGLRAHLLSWSPDSRNLLLSVPYHLSNQIFTLSIPAGSLRQYTEQDDMDFYAAH